MMTSLFKVFVSSVQKELEDERLIIQNLLNTDPFLSAHCTYRLKELVQSSSNRKVKSTNRKVKGKYGED